MLGLRPSQNRSFVSAINFTKNGSGVCEMILQLPERRRFIVWPKKDILFADLSSIATPIANNGKRWSPVKFCFRLIWHHFSYSKSRSINYAKWNEICCKRTKFTGEFSYAVFSLARFLDVRDGGSCLSDGNSGKCEISSLIVVLLLMDKDKTFSGTLIKRYSFLETFCFFLLLCEPSSAEHYVSSQKLAFPPIVQKFPMVALKNLDKVFEGILLNASGAASHAILSKVPKPFSEVFFKYFGHMNENECSELDFSSLVKVIHESVQPNMFLLDKIEWPKCTANSRRTISITSVRSPEYRRVCITRWNHIQLLTAPIYEGCNLHINNGDSKSSALFHPKFLNSLVVQNCQHVGSIVVGPVKCFSLLRNNQNCKIALICPRIRLENCQNITLFVNTQTPLLLNGNCGNIQVAPYNSYYNALFNELDNAGLELLTHSENCWNKVVQVNQILAIAKGDNNIVYKVLSPNSFYFQPNPFDERKNDVTFERFKSTIPTEYLQSWERTRKHFARVDPLDMLKSLNSLEKFKSDLNYILKRIWR